MITRARVEAVGETSNDVIDELTKAMETLKHDNKFEGEWIEEDRKVFQTRNGWWGHLTWRRRDNGDA